MPREVPKIGSGAVLGSGESPWVHKLLQGRFIRDYIGDYYRGY